MTRNDPQAFMYTESISSVGHRSDLRKKPPHLELAQQTPTCKAVLPTFLKSNAPPGWATHDKEGTR